LKNPPSTSRCEQIHAGGHHLDLAVQPEHQARSEVDQPAGDRVVGALEVHDDRDTLLEPFPDVTRVVEPSGLRTVDGGHGGNA
jgi:hypothetical protein